MECRLPSMGLDDALVQGSKCCKLPPVAYVNTVAGAPFASNEAIVYAIHNLPFKSYKTTASPPSFLAVLAVHAWEEQEA